MARLVIHLLAVSAVLVGLPTLVMPGLSLAASRPTDTPVPSATPYPTYTPAPTGTPYPTATALPVRGQVLLSSSSGMDGSALIAAASGFSPHAGLTLRWDGVALATATTDGGGYARLDLRVPRDAPLGPHEVRVDGPRQEEATALYEVAQTYRPALTLSTARVVRGATLGVSASGFAPGGTLTLYLDRVAAADALGAAVADAGGAVAQDVTIDLRTAPGSHRVIAAANALALRADAFVEVAAAPVACGGVTIPLPFVDPLCIDPFRWLGEKLSGAATDAATSIGESVAPALIVQPDYTQNDALGKLFTTVQDFARDLFGILFVAGVLTWYVRRLGLGSPGDAGVQIMEAAAGLGLVSFLPTLLSASVKAANALSGAILTSAAKDGAAVIRQLIVNVVALNLTSGFSALPLVLLLLVGVVLVFLVLLLLIIVTRDIGIIYGAAVFVAAPLCVVCGITPLTRGVALAWARLWISLTLWGTWYALAFVVVGAELDTFAGMAPVPPAASTARAAMPLAHATAAAGQGGLSALVAALAGLLVIYGAPKLGDALIGGGAARALGIGHVPLLSTVVAVTAGAATGGTLSAVGGALTTGGSGAAGATSSGGSGGGGSAGASAGDASNPAWGMSDGAGV